ncbi:dehydrogenase [Pseudokineococcus basanitobsidens]|uniref:Dehydrogenase n=1 Tax=Pseudokineococcus basanitobsidens TaxID=1926649 RepID=A0ABU8RH87_9ACTN
MVRSGVDTAPPRAAASLRATAYWTTGPGRGELRTEDLPAPADGEVLVETLHTGVSRGTELLVHRGGVPASVADRMRAPFQVGDLRAPSAEAPVKHGYLAVGVVAQGPEELRGRRVFCLHPHQDRFVVPVGALAPVPDAVPSRRAVLAGTVETAVNALWDAAPRWGDRVAVIGAGMVGGSVAALLRSFPLARLQLLEPDPARAEVARRLGVDVVHPDEAAGGCDVVVHASASGAGLSRGLALLGDEGELVEMSWYGDREVPVALGADFHARRLVVRASQVGAVAPARRVRRTTADRLALALDALADDAFDALLAPSVPLADLPGAMARLAAGDPVEPCLVVDHPAGTSAGTARAPGSSSQGTATAVGPADHRGETSA